MCYNKSRRNQLDGYLRTIHIMFWGYASPISELPTAIGSSLSICIISFERDNGANCANYGCDAADYSPNIRGYKIFFSRKPYDRKV